ncbi:hypothetical protein KVA01_17230 [Kocuria varians]|uniref:Uncharacterized protein n=1 Tax=Kocuria varians TaxID=1272 RepID=A0A4Y4D2Z8_KOCVA|nr:hypothetical protein KVA01_17230 [Kocuria varians]
MRQRDRDTASGQNGVAALKKRAEDLCRLRVTRHDIPHVKRQGGLLVPPHHKARPMTWPASSMATCDH